MIKPSKSKKKPAPAAQSPAAAQPSSLKLVFLGWYGVIGMTLGYVSPVKLPWAEGYAKDYWRHALGSLLVVLMLLASGVGAALYLLDVNDFKDQIVSYVKTHKQRDLVIEGDIHLNFFPTLGLDTGKMSLSQRNSGRTFASVDNARLYVAWWPLLRKQVQVERIVLDGLHANLVRHPDGSTNFDDLLVPAEWMGEVQFEIDKIRVLESSLNFHDEGSGRALFFNALNLETGRLADATAGQVNTSFRLQSVQPQLDLQVQLGGNVLYEHAHQRYAVADLEGQARGEAAGISDLVLDWRGALAAQPASGQLTLDKFSSTAKGRYEQRNFEARLSAATLKLEQQLWRGGTVSLGASMQQDKNLLSASLELPAVEMDGKSLRSDNVQIALDLFPGEAALQGKFNSPLSFEFETGQLQLAAINGSWNVNHPVLAGKLSASSSGKLQANWPAQEAKLDFKTKVDESELSGTVQLQDFKAPAWSFDLAANTLDLDRYLVGDWVQRLQTAALALDASALQTLDLKGKLRSEELRAARFKASQFVAELRAGADTLSIEPLQAKFYGGSLQGELSLKTGTDGPQFSARQKLNGVQVDALLGDLYPGEARLSGKGNVAFDLSSQGSSAQALRQSLHGTASLALSRGQLAGLNLPEALLAGKEQFGLEGAERSDNLRLTESTPYGELKATFDVAQGQARSNDFVLKAAQYSCKGEGNYTLENGQLDARLSAMVAPNLKRSNAGELAELSGISTPLQISGPWATAGVRYALGEASGGNLARLAKANRTRIAAATAVAAAGPVAAMTADVATAAPAHATASTPKPATMAKPGANTKPAPPAKPTLPTTAAATPVAPRAGASKSVGK